MQPPSYAIRLVRQDELPKLQVIEKAAAQRFRDTAQSWIVDDDGMDLEQLEHWLRHGKIWVAVDSAGEPVGFAVAHPIDGTAYLHELDVHPQHSRRGLGGRLIDEVVTWARDCGYSAVTLSTFAEIPWNAPYYHRLGFRTLREQELGPGLCEVRADEAAGGLDLDTRICMIRPV